MNTMQQKIMDSHKYANTNCFMDTLASMTPDTVFHFTSPFVDTFVKDIGDEGQKILQKYKSDLAMTDNVDELRKSVTDKIDMLLNILNMTAQSEFHTMIPSLLISFKKEQWPDDTSKMEDWRLFLDIIIAMGDKSHIGIINNYLTPALKSSNNECPICLRSAMEVNNNGVIVDWIFMKSKGPCKHAACRTCYKRAIAMKKNATRIDLSEFCFLCNY